MLEELFSIGPLSISPFGVLMAMAFLAGYWQLSRGLRRTGAGTADDAGAIALAAGVGGIVGAKVYYAILYQDLRLLVTREGLVWYGGFLLGALLVIWVVRRRRLPVWGALDAAGPALMLGYAIGRLGCFVVGDDYGVPSELPWAVAFPVGLPPTTAGNLQEYFGVPVPPDVGYNELLRVHPTQLYEALAALAIWGIAVWLLGRRRPAGTVTLTVLVLFSLERFAVEFLRAKDDRFFGGLTLAQMISLAVLAIALGLWAKRRSGAARPVSP